MEKIIRKVLFASVLLGGSLLNISANAYNEVKTQTTSAAIETRVLDEHNKTYYLQHGTAMGYDRVVGGYQYNYTEGTGHAGSYFAVYVKDYYSNNTLAAADCNNGKYNYASYKNTNKIAHYHYVAGSMMY